MPSSNQLNHTSNNPESESGNTDAASEWTNLADEIPFDPNQAENLRTEKVEQMQEDTDSLSEDQVDEPNQEAYPDAQDPDDFSPETKPKKMGNMLELKNILAEARKNHQSEDDAWEQYWSDHIVPDVSDNLTVAGNNPYIAFRMDRHLQRKLELIDSHTRYDDAERWLKEVESDMQAYGVKATEGGVFERNLQDARKVVARKARNPFNRLRRFINKHLSSNKSKD